MAAQDPSALGLDRITAQEAANRLMKCGLGPVTIRWNDPNSGGEDILVATEVKSATDEQLRCADKAISYYTVELSPEIDRRFHALREDRLAPVFQEQARSWLSARGLLKRLPKYQAGVTDDGAFTRQIETLCGPHAKGAFQSTFGYHVLSPDWVKRELAPPDKGNQVLACLMNATRATGFDFGFIGNEAD
ncbi:hypothetical protein GRI58_15395 [Porphyrobacter algicida]|uniref:Uncharacterized protein n=1 Tax=Qipengyuania algicida TaxID=1836209 RepID=A0A845AKQ2_9SPHN|nr:hypothetical protein [Qipengyuania algicida]MXP30194.1 hypothetical protein [Qipengyuania algicida]